MLTQQVASRPFHLVHIQRVMVMQRRIPVEYSRMGGVVDGIPVMLSYHVKPGVEALRHVAVYHSYVSGKAYVQRIGEFIGRYAAFGIEVGYLCHGVYAAVCPAGGVKVCLLPRELPKLPLNYFLHRQAVGLRLPAHIARAVVLNYKAYPRHVLIPL